MPRIRSSKKHERQSRKRRLLNRDQRASLRTALKKVRTAADPTAARSAFDTAEQLIDRAARKGLIHRNTAARHKSRLSKLVRPKAT